MFLLYFLTVISSPKFFSVHSIVSLHSHHYSFLYHPSYFLLPLYFCLFSHAPPNSDPLLFCNWAQGCHPWSKSQNEGFISTDGWYSLGVWIRLEKLPLLPSWIPGIIEGVKTDNIIVHGSFQSHLLYMKNLTKTLIFTSKKSCRKVHTQWVFSVCLGKDAITLWAVCCTSLVFNCTFLLF